MLRTSSISRRLATAVLAGAVFGSSGGLVAVLAPVVASAAVDSDGDGLNDDFEIANHLDPQNPDSDRDFLSDGDELHKYYTGPSNQDSDDDGVSDGDEVLRNHTDPNYNPTRDPDKDGLESPYEIDAGLDPQNPDSDRDGLNDGDEVDKYKTGPLNQDTDNDGISDGDEVLRYHTNPLAASPKPAAEQPPAPQP